MASDSGAPPTWQQNMSSAFGHPLDSAAMAGAEATDYVSSLFGVETNYAPAVFAETQKDFGSTLSEETNIAGAAMATQQLGGPGGVITTAAANTVADFGKAAKAAEDALPTLPQAGSIVVFVLIALAFFYGLGKGAFK